MWKVITVLNGVTLASISRVSTIHCRETMGGGWDEDQGVDPGSGKLVFETKFEQQRLGGSAMPRKLQVESRRATASGASSSNPQGLGRAGEEREAHVSVPRGGTPDL